MKRNSEISSLKEGIDAWLKALRIEKKFDSSKIIAEWENIVGKLIADRTQKIYIKDKKLHIKVDSAPLKKELQFSKEKIKDLIWDYTQNDQIVKEIIIL